MRPPLPPPASPSSRYRDWFGILVPLPYKARSSLVWRTVELINDDRRRFG